MFGRHLTKHADVHAYDIRQDDAIKLKAAESKVSFHENLSAAVEDAEFVLSLVTADQAHIVADQASPLLGQGQYFLEMNSVAPGTKQASAKNCTSLVDIAIMAPIYPREADVPLLLAHASGDALAEKLSALGLNVRCVGEEIGRSAAIKMCRSVMIKGMEALTLECFGAARHYNVEDEIKRSLHASFPGMGWDKDRVDYWFDRVATHGVRRAAEMREVAKTVKEAGLDSEMSATVAETFDKFTHRNNR